MQETFEFIAPASEQLRKMTTAYVNQLEEVKEDNDMCYCGKDKG